MERTRFAEIWKPVPFIGYENYYQVSNQGRVRNVDRIVTFLNNPNRKRLFKGKIASLNTKGAYNQVTLIINGIRKYPTVHRLVAIAFVPNLENKPQVNHIDGNKKNNKASNLEWVTASENMKHSFDVLGRVGVNKGRLTKDNNSCKKVSQYTKEGIFVKTHNSLKEAGEATNTDPGFICSVCKDIHKYAKGFIWKYEKITHNQILASYADRVFETSIRKGVTKVKQS